MESSNFNRSDYATFHFIILLSFCFDLIRHFRTCITLVLAIFFINKSFYRWIAVRLGFAQKFRCPPRAVRGFTWKVPFCTASIWLCCSSRTRRRFRKWKDVSGTDLSLLLLKSRCWTIVRGRMASAGTLLREAAKPWDTFSVSSECPTCDRETIFT